MRVGGYATGLGVGNGTPAASSKSIPKSRTATSIRARSGIDSRTALAMWQSSSRSAIAADAVLNQLPQAGEVGYYTQAEQLLAH